MRATTTVLACTALSLCLISCGVEEGPPSFGVAEELGWIEGTIDVVSGNVQYRTGRSEIDLDNAPYVQQPLVAVTEDRNGVQGTASSPDSAEFVVECNGTPTCPTGFVRPGAVTNGCGGGLNSFEMDVTLRSFFPAGLATAYAEFTEIKNLGVDGRAGTGDAFEGADSTICNKDTVPLNLSVGPTPLDATLGLYRYGQLIANPSAPTGAPVLAADTARWKFKNPGGQIKFRARIVGEACVTDCTPGRGLNTFWEAEGATGAGVSAVAEGPGVVYLGGSFNYVGPRTGSSAVVNGSAAVSSTPGALLNGLAIDGGDVLVALSDGAGGFFVGGAFTTVGSAARQGLVHVDASGQVDTGFSVNVLGSVRALALTSSGGLVIGGLFTTVNGVSRTNLALVDRNTGAVASTWLANTNGQVNALLAHDGRLFVGGAFTTLTDLSGTTAVDRVARLDELTGAVNATFATVGASATVNALAVGTANGSPANRTLIVGGAFTQFRASNTPGLVSRQRIAFVDVDANSLTATSFTIPSEVTALAASGGDIYVGGSFTTVNGLSRLRSALVTEAGSVASWRPFLNDTVFSIVVDAVNNQVYLGGGFAARALAVNATSGANVSWPIAIGPNNATSGAASAVRAIALSGSSVLVGGSFRSIGGVTRFGAAALSIATGEPTSWAPFASAQSVTALDVIDGDVVVATPAAVQRVDGNTASLEWSQPVTGGPVRAFAHDSVGRLYVGGAFTTLAAASRSGIGALDSSTGSLLGWTADVSTGGVVRGIAVFRGEVYVGGDFNSLSGSPGLDFGVVTSAAIAGPATVRRFWQTNTNGKVNAVAAGRDSVFVGGFFTTIDGASRSSLAAVDGTSVLPFSGNANQEVEAIADVGNSVLVAGNLTTLGGQSCARACAVNKRGVSAGIFSAGLSSRAVAVASLGGSVAIGGTFTSSSVNLAQARSGFAAITGE